MLSGTYAGRQGASTTDLETPLAFSDHAKRRMLRRHISEDVVRQVIAEPDHTNEREDGCAEYVALVQDGFRERRIEVVLDERTDLRNVVTVYELEREWQ